MKKLLSGVALVALLVWLTPQQSDKDVFKAMPYWMGIMPVSTTPPVASSQTSTHTATPAATSISWSTVDLGVAASDRKIAMFVTLRATSGSATVTVATINGVTAYIIKQLTNGSNTLALVVADVPTGTTNTTVSLTFSASVAACSIFVNRLVGAALSVPSDIQTQTTDNTAMNVYVPAGCGLLAAVIAQTSTSGTTWTNATEVTDAVYNGTTLHSSARVDISSEAASRAVTADVGGTVTEYAAMVVTFQPNGGKAFIAANNVEYLSGANNSSYTFSSSYIGVPHAGRVVIVSVVSGTVGTRTINTCTVAGVSATRVVRATGTDANDWGNTAIFVVSLDASYGSVADIVITCSATAKGLNASVMSAYLLNSTTAYDIASTVLSSSAGDISASLDIPNNGICVSSHGSFNAVDLTMSYTNLTQSFETFLSEGINMNGGYNSRMSTESNRTLTVTASGADSRRTMVAASFS